jgi:uncharacterized membrane protein (UPF0127 family)
MEIIGAVRFAVYNETKNRARLASSAESADTFGSRFKGLLGRDKLDEGGGLHINPCNSIHMFFMKFAIDVVFLDERLCVVKVIHGIKPWRATRVYSRAQSVLELPEGVLARTGTMEGDRLRFEPIEPAAAAGSH